MPNKRIHLILAPIIRAKKGTYEKLFDELKQYGFSRIRLDSQIINLEDDEVAEKQG